MTGIALSQGDNRHELGDVLPSTYDIGDPGTFEIRPNGRCAEWEAEMKPRWLHWRRTQQDRIVPIVNGRDLHDRRRSRLGCVIARKLAERSFRERRFWKWKQCAFKNNFRIRGNR